MCQRLKELQNHGCQNKMTKLFLQPSQRLQFSALIQRSNIPYTSGSPTFSTLYQLRKLSDLSESHRDDQH